jgi:hypothetical protein
VLHVNPHAVPLHVSVALATAAHGVHAIAPQELVLVFGWQVPLQSWLPVGHIPTHEAVEAMHMPKHSFCPVGQVPLHDVPSQVGVPPVGTGHAMQDVPQVATSVLLAQVDPQAW